MSNALDREFDQVLKMIDELRRAAEPDPHQDSAWAERCGLGSGADEEIEWAPEPTLVPEPFRWAPQPRSWIGITVRFAAMAAIAVFIVVLIVGKRPTSLSVATNEHLEELSSVAPGLLEPSKSDAFDRTTNAPEQAAPTNPEIAVDKESSEQRAPESAPPRVTIAADATGERTLSTTAQEVTPESAQRMGLVTRQLDREETAALRKRGEDLIRSGDLASARLLLQRAAEAGDVDAAMALAGTFDPNLLVALGQGYAADVAKARSWYERAKQFGSTEASRRLEQLANNSVSSGSGVPPHNETLPPPPANTGLLKAASRSTAAVMPTNSAADNAKRRAQAPSQPKCDVNTCNSAYVSFRESDCTYQPRNGPRRLCTKQN